MALYFATNLAKASKESNELHEDKSSPVQENQTVLFHEQQTNKGLYIDNVNEISVEPSCTIVTSLLDIGRGSWPVYRRTIEFYLSSMQRILALNAKLFIFADNYTAPIVEKVRRGNNISKNTFVKVIKLEDLLYYPYLVHIKTIVETEQRFWRPDWNVALKMHPEAFSANYILLMNSKLSMVQQATQINPFNSTHFFWLDAGYGHGKKEVVFPTHSPLIPWCPKKLLNNKSTVSLLILAPMLDRRYLTLEKLYRQDLTLIIGGFFGGSKKQMRKLFVLYDQVFKYMLFEARAVDDDQTVLALCYDKKPDLFNLIYANWYDVFVLFP